MPRVVRYVCSMLIFLKNKTKTKTKFEEEKEKKFFLQKGARMKNWANWIYNSLKIPQWNGA